MEPKPRRNQSQEDEEVTVQTPEPAAAEVKEEVPEQEEEVPEEEETDSVAKTQEPDSYEARAAARKARRQKR